MLYGGESWWIYHPPQSEPTCVVEVLTALRVPWAWLGIHHQQVTLYCKYLVYMPLEPCDPGLTQAPFTQGTDTAPSLWYDFWLVELCNLFFTTVTVLAVVHTSATEFVPELTPGFSGWELCCTHPVSTDPPALLAGVMYEYHYWHYYQRERNFGNLNLNFEKCLLATGKSSQPI